MNTHRIDENGFLDTKTPEQYFEDSTRGMLDSEFSYDAPREPAGWFAAVALILAGLLLGAVFYALQSGINLLFGVAE